MTRSFYLPFHILHFTLISHFSFHKWQLLNAKLLKIENCKLIIAASRGSA